MTTEAVADTGDLAGVEPFRSLEAMREAHVSLRRRFPFDAESGLTGSRDIRLFMHQVEQTGTILQTARERREAHDILDFWVSFLLLHNQDLEEVDLAAHDPNLEPILPDEPRPFVGLAAFDYTTQEYFFGRERLIDAFVEQLRIAPALVILGASGSGKSSLLRAGLIPALQRGVLPRSGQWAYIGPVLPGHDPLQALAEACTRYFRSKGESNALIGKQHLHRPDLLARLCNHIGRPTVFILDQFEELFTLGSNKADRDLFARNLLNLLDPAHPHRHVLVLAMRADFEEALLALLPEEKGEGEQDRAALSFRSPLLRQSNVAVTALSARELREAIERPAERVGLRFEEGVVDELIADVLGEPGALPLLQFSLNRLWEQRVRSRITMLAYRNLGNSKLLLSKSADELYDNLLPEDQFTARRILLRMVRPGEGVEVTSNRVRVRDLFRSGEASDRVRRVLDKLIGAGLVRLPSPDEQRTDQVEIAHEALIRNWPRLVRWVEEDRKQLRRRQPITDAARRWEDAGKDASFLWRGRLLREALIDPASVHDLSPAERAFLGASVMAEAQEQEVQAAAAQRELERQQMLVAEQARAEAEERMRRELEIRAEAEEQMRREEQRRAEAQAVRSRRLSWLAGTLLLATFVAIVAAGIFFQQQQQLVSIGGILTNQVSSATALAATSAVEQSTALAVNTGAALRDSEAQAAIQTRDSAQTLATLDEATSQALEATAAVLASNNAVNQATSTAQMEKITSRDATLAAVQQTSTQVAGDLATATVSLAELNDTRATVGTALVDLNASSTAVTGALATSASELATATRELATVRAEVGALNPALATVQAAQTSIAQTSTAEVTPILTLTSTP